MAASQPGDNTATAMNSVVVDLDDYDWEGTGPHAPFRDDGDLRGARGGTDEEPQFRCCPEKRGTYAGLMEKIPYLKTSASRPSSSCPYSSLTTKDAPPGKANYWGYAPVSFFAPHSGYSSGRTTPALSTNSAIW
jgi:glycogen operon protein